MLTIAWQFLKWMQHNLSETNVEAGYEQIVAMGCRHSNSFTTSGADLQISE